MAAQKFLVSIDLNQNELLRGVLQNETSDPVSGVAGQLYFNTTSNKPFYHNGTAWVVFGGGAIEEIVANGGLKFTSGDGLGPIVNLEVEVDDASLYIDPATAGGVVKIKPLGVLTAHIANSNVTTEKINNGAVTFAKMQDIAELKIIGRVSSGAGDPEEVTVQTTLTDSDTVVATSGAIIDYVDGAITALGALQGSWDAPSTNFPSTRPPEGTGDPIQAGDYWYITTGGTMGTGTVVNIGDVIYAAIDTPGQTDDNWFVVESNRDQATETVLGLAKIATTAQVTAGTDDTTIVTPLKLEEKLDEHYAVWGATIKDFNLIGDDITKEFICDHGLTTNDVHVEVHDSTTKDTVQVHVTRTSTAAVTVTFNVAPATGTDYRAVVIGKDSVVN